MRKFRKYEEGGPVDEMDMDAPPPRDINGINAPEDVKDISFKEAFRRAKDAGLKSFAFKGKKFTTDMAAPKAKAATKASEPALLGPTPTKSRGMFSKMFNETRESDRKVVDAAIRGRLAREAAEKSGMKCGGKVKAYAKGGSVTRGDGCAQRGHTKGKNR
jgi:hypothetical protein